MIDRDRHAEIESADAEDDLAPLPLIVVPHRESRLGQRLWPAIALLVVALLGILYRASVADWQGLARRTEPSSPKLVAKPPEPVEPIQAVKPIEIARAPEIVKPEPKVVEDSPPKPKVDPWKEIEREAEKKRAERAELDQIKESEAEKALTQPLRPIPPPNRPIPGDLMAEHQRRMLKQFEQARRQHLEMQERFIRQFNQGRGSGAQRQLQEMLRQQQEMLSRLERQGFGPGLPPMPPLNGGDRAGFPNIGRDEPGFRTERKAIRTPNGIVIIERQWSLNGNRVPDPPEPGKDR